MEIIQIPGIMKDAAKTHRSQGRTIGFVPTMGALHEGHLSLVNAAKQENALTVASIYINPLQFGSSEDLAVYPRDFAGDTEKLRDAGVDVLFLPDDSSMYPPGFCTGVEVKGLSEKLCGGHRPGHFSGVATVVAKLINIVEPDRAYFGQKDFQQGLIAKRLAKDLDMSTEIVICPTVREKDGLAMSSRNQYLTPQERDTAPVIYRCLAEAHRAVKTGVLQVSSIKELMLDILGQEPLVSEIQYCSAYDPGTLDELKVIGKEALLAVALKLGSTRLIDNMLIRQANNSGGR